MERRNTYVQEKKRKKFVRVLKSQGCRVVRQMVNGSSNQTIASCAKDCSGKTVIESEQAKCCGKIRGYTVV